MQDEPKPCAHEKTFTWELCKDSCVPDQLMLSCDDCKALLGHKNKNDAEFTMVTDI